MTTFSDQPESQEQSKPERIMMQKAPNRWTCIPTVTAMILQKPVEEVIALIPTDGSEIIHTEFPPDDPRSRRGYTLGDLFDLCERDGYHIWATCADQEVCHAKLKSLEQCWDRIYVLYGTSERGIPHVSILYNGVYYDTDSSRNNIPGMTVEDILYVQEPIDGSKRRLGN